MIEKPLLLKITAIVSLLIFMVFSPCMAGMEGRMDLLELSGTYFEIGEKWGKAAKNDIRTSIEIEINGLADFFKIEKQILISMASKFLPKAEECDPDFIEVLNGISEGADIPFEEIFALRAYLELMFFMHKIPAMCTSFAVTGGATKEGHTIIGENIDWHPGIPLKLLRITWPNNVKQLSLSLGGIWEYSLSSHPSSSPFGIVATGTVAYTEEQDIKKPPISIVMSKASRQKRMEGALSIFVNEKKDLASFLLANGDGDMVGFECVSNDVEVMYPDYNTLVRSNHYLTDRFKPNDFFSSYVPDSYLRYARLKRLIAENYGTLTPQMMMKFMADHNSYPKSICSHVDSESELPPSKTLASIIMIPEAKAMYVASGNPCETEYKKYTIE